MGVFQKFSLGLKKTRDNMSNTINNILNSFSSIDDELYDELEEALVLGDVGVNTSTKIISELRTNVRKKGIKNPEEVKVLIRETVEEMISGGEELTLNTKPSIILVIGVNGGGKTTSIGKMAAMYKAQGKKVILGAADTFRAAAIDQLEVWANRAGVDIVKHKEGADPAAVVFDTIAAGKSRNADIIICDTAGRLHNKKNLMEELAKIYRIVDRELPEADKETLLVLDATTGQNAVNQAKEFGNAAKITGIILTKIDGTAKGGVVLSIKNELGIPVKFIGVGEKIDDLQPFNAKAFAEGLFGENQESAQEDEENEYIEENIPDNNGCLADSEEHSEEIQEKEETTEPDNDSAQRDEIGVSECESQDETDKTENENIEQSEKVEDIDQPEENEEDIEVDNKKQKKERKKRFGFFNRHS